MFSGHLFLAASRSLRHLHPDQVEEQKGRVAAQQKRIKLGFMFHS
jgi:hypothetical protein